jgi:MinD-like ATPase involved in chromosome partitioning or flagellar assembly
MPTGLLTAGGGHAWETDVVAALGRPGSPLTVLRRCADMADVLAEASTGQASACLLAADLRRLDTDSVQQLAACSVAVVVVHPAGDRWASVRLDRIGVRHLVADDAGTDALIAAVRDAVDAAARPGVAGGAPPRSTADPRWALGSFRAGTGTGPGRTGAPATPASGDPTGRRNAGDPGRSGGSGSLGAAGPTDAAPVTAGTSVGGSATRPSSFRADRVGGGDPSDTEPQVDRAAVSGPDEDRRVPGRVVAVWGPTGAPGRSTVAAGLAAAAADAGQRVLLIDADVYGGVLASAFGLLDESAGLAGVCRLAANGRLDEAELARMCWSVGDRLSLLTGIARADRWPEVRPSTIPAVLALARRLADLVVVDCAFALESDEEISFDTMAPRRNGATLAVLDDADEVLAVGSADPPGTERLIRGLTELGEAVDGVVPRVVINRLRRTAASDGEVAAALRRFAGTEPVAVLPEDRAACDRAWQRGVGVAEAAPKSALTAGLAALATAVLASSGVPR